MTQSMKRGEVLSILTRAPAESVKTLAENLLPHLGTIRVIKNRTGLVMLPYMDSAQGTAFHLGELLVSEAHIHVEFSDNSEEGYGMVLGRDLTQAMALAVLDAAIALGVMTADIMTYVEAQAHEQIEADTEMLKQVEATRVEMETF